MVSRKYAGDYRLENRTDAKGRVKTVAVYRGRDYFFEDPRARERGTRRTLALLALALWPELIVPLIPQTLAGRTAWIVLPYAAALMPALFLSMSVWNYLRAREPMHREIADRISGRVPICTLLTAILTLAALVGEIVQIILQWSLLAPADALFALCAAAACAGSIRAHGLSRRLRTAPAPEKPPEPEALPDGEPET